LKTLFTKNLGPDPNPESANPDSGHWRNKYVSLTCTGSTKIKVKQGETAKYKSKDEQGSSHIPLPYALILDEKKNYNIQKEKKVLKFACGHKNV
jgi:hypothetical protein